MGPPRAHYIYSGGADTARSADATDNLSCWHVRAATSRQGPSRRRAAGCGSPALGGRPDGDGAVRATGSIQSWGVRAGLRCVLGLLFGFRSCRLWSRVSDVAVTSLSSRRVNFTVSSRIDSPQWGYYPPPAGTFRSHVPFAVRTICHASFPISGECLGRRLMRTADAGRVRRPLMTFFSAGGGRWPADGGPAHPAPRPADPPHIL